MYGFVHCCLEDLVIKLFGEDAWKEILKKSGVKLRGASFLMHKIYGDEITLKLVVTTSEVSGLDVETCLEAFGKHFLKYCQQNGYDQILRVLGSNLHDFLTNLDNLHDHLESIYPGMRAPSFRVTHTPEGVMHLHYYSVRVGLSAIVRGLVTTVAEEFFDTQVTVRTLEERTEDGHVVLEVKRKVAEGHENDPQAESLMGTPLAPVLESVQSPNPSDSLFAVKTICDAFPFHMMFKSDFRIIQIGNSLLRLTQTIWRKQKVVKFSDLFTITRPMIEGTYESMLSYCNQVFVVSSKPGVLENSPEKSQPLDGSLNNNLLCLRLKGQIMPVPESDAILFMCSPRVNGLEEVQRLGLYLSDFPVHDRARDLILMHYQRKGERDLVEKLDEASNQLRIADSRLRDENKRTELILNNIFPAKIASMLCQNIPVYPEQYKTVSCLFSDIVSFTSMCGADNMVPMDIVRLLNKLYIQFDSLSNVHGVYKVETIGDAYVVVGGLPEYVEDHADRVVAMGLDMVRVTNSVMSPVDGKPIQMRIGINSGAVMAGIVGIQMPRYCLFGNTVTLSNRMESNSKPGEVHISLEAKSYLIREGYLFRENTSLAGFPLKTFFVTSLLPPRPLDYMDTHETLETMNLSPETGLLISPSGTPSPSSRRNSSPEASPPYASQSLRSFKWSVDSPKPDTQIYPNVATLESGTKIILPDIRVSEPTPIHGINADIMSGGLKCPFSQNLSLRMRTSIKSLDITSEHSQSSEKSSPPLQEKVNAEQRKEKKRGCFPRFWGLFRFKSTKNKISLKGSPKISCQLKGVPMGRQEMFKPTEKGEIKGAPEEREKERNENKSTGRRKGCFHFGI